MNFSPPADLDAEQGVIAAMADRPLEVDEAVAALTPDDFTDDRSRRLFEAACDLRGRGLSFEFAPIARHLRDTDRLHAIGNVSGLEAALEKPTRAITIEHYAKALRQKTRLRRLIRECALVASEAAQNPHDADGFIDGAEARLLAATSEHATSRAEWIGDLVREEAARLVRVANGERVDGVPYGIGALDEMTGGMRPGEITVVAGRPGMGKTALGLNIACSAAASNHGDVAHVVFFASLEMSSRQLVRRALSSRAKVDLRHFERRSETTAETERYHATGKELVGLPILLDETVRMSPAQLRAQVRRARSAYTKARGPLGIPQQLSVVVVDYLQRMGSDIRRKERFAEVADNINAIADSAKELGVHIVVLAQLNRENAKRQGTAQRPRMSDLAESGEIEKAAHTIVLLHRPEYYVQDKDDVPESVRGLAELNVDKQRNGPTGIVNVRFSGEHTLFEDPSTEDVERWMGGAPKSGARASTGHASGCRCAGCRARAA